MWDIFFKKMQYSWETRISYDKDNDNNMNTDFWRYRYGDWSKTYSSSSIFWGDEHPAISAILGFTRYQRFDPLPHVIYRLSITCHHFVRNPGSGTRGQDHCTDQLQSLRLNRNPLGDAGLLRAWFPWIEVWGWKKNPMVLWKNEDEWGLL